MLTYAFGLASEEYMKIIGACDYTFILRFLNLKFSTSILVCWSVNFSRDIEIRLRKNLFHEKERPRKIKLLYPIRKMLSLI